MYGVTDKSEKKKPSLFTSTPVLSASLYPISSPTVTTLSPTNTSLDSSPLILSPKSLNSPLTSATHVATFRTEKDKRNSNSNTSGTPNAESEPSSTVVMMNRHRIPNEQEVMMNVLKVKFTRPTTTTAAAAFQSPAPTTTTIAAATITNDPTPSTPRLVETSMATVNIRGLPSSTGTPVLPAASLAALGDKSSDNADQNQTPQLKPLSQPQELPGGVHVLSSQMHVIDLDHPNEKAVNQMIRVSYANVMSSAAASSGNVTAIDASSSAVAVDATFAVVSSQARVKSPKNQQK